MIDNQLTSYIYVVYIYLFEYLNFSRLSEWVVCVLLGCSVLIYNCLSVVVVVKDLNLYVAVVFVVVKYIFFKRLNLYN